MPTISESLAMAVQHHQAGRLHAAEQVCVQILAVDSNHVAALHLVGVISFQAGKHALATAYLSRAIELNGSDAALHNNLGHAFQAQGRLDDAVACFRRAVELKPDYALAHYNLGVAFADQDRLAEAVAAYSCAIELDPHDGESQNGLGIAFQHCRRFNDAAARYGRALELKPDLAEAHLGRATLNLLLGDLLRGWPEYEWRWKTEALKEREFSQPLWDGKPLEERTILLHAEQGFGDTLQFVRYAALVKQQNAAATVVVECQRPLAKLLAKCAGIDRHVAQGDELPPFDMHSPLLSLPGIFKTTVETIPASVPYLFAEEGLVVHWRERLKDVRGVRIGINWQGRGGQGEFRKRDIPLEMLRRWRRFLG